MKDNKGRLFEIMGAINPGFQQTKQQTPENPDFQLKTYGDLKRIVNVIKLQQKGKKIAGIGFDAILGSIPFLGTAKTAYDVYKAAFTKPDSKKTNTWLDKLDVDDEVSAIVDDKVENGFLQAMSDIFNREPDDKTLEPDFDMNQKMVEYLAGKYDNRTISGIPSGV